MNTKRTVKFIMGFHWWSLLSCLMMIFASGCDRQEKPASTSEANRTSPRQAGTAAVTSDRQIYVSFYPVAYFTQRIAGDLVEVVCPCPPDEDPAYWTPGDATVAKFQQADLIIVNGATFERGLAKVTLPESRVVETAKPFQDEFIVLKNAITHSHGPSGSHSHEGIDGHTWLDPINAKIQAGEIKTALARQYPEHAEAFEEGYAALVRDLDALDARLKVLSEKLGDELLLCSHPAYNYVARRYGWQLKTYLLDPEEMPDDATFAEMKSYLEQQPARLMLWEAQPTEEIAQRMTDELGLQNVVYSPCEALDADELVDGMDFLTVMNENVTRLEAALAGE